MVSASESEASSAKHMKSASAYRTISEVAAELDVPQHVLRFWESKFPQVRPLKRGGGRRYYRPEDVDTLRHIRALLYEDGYTIKGAQKLLRVGRRKAGDKGGEPPREAPGTDANGRKEVALAAPAEPPPRDGALRRELEMVLEELVALRNMLRPLT